MFKPRSVSQTKGMIYNISNDVSEEELMRSLKGGNITGVKRMGKNDRGFTPILLTFKDEELPKKVMLGYMSYSVRTYERPPLRCFKCQKFGHGADGVVEIMMGKNAKKQLSAATVEVITQLHIGDIYFNKKLRM